MPPQRNIIPISVSRITYKSTASFETVEARLVSSIRHGSGTSAWPAVAKDIPRSPTGRADFVSAVGKVLGPHEFMEFYSINHGAWLPIYSPETSKSKVDGKALQSKRFILGNPLIAITMLEHDIDAGLFVPVEVLVVEDEEGQGCRVVYMLPSGLVAGYEGASENLVEAAKTLDDRLEVLVRDITKD